MAGSMASSWLQSGVQGSLQLGLLPCSIEDAMHPGETRELFTFEDRFTALFKDAIAMHGCMCAQRLELLAQKGLKLGLTPMFRPTGSI